MGRHCNRLCLRLLPFDDASRRVSHQAKPREKEAYSCEHEHGTYSEQRIA
jgi:hypothetical protein